MYIYELIPFVVMYPKAHAFSTGRLSYSHALNPPFSCPPHAPLHSKHLSLYRQKLPKKICWQMHLGTFVMALIHQFVGEGTTLCWPKTTWSSDTMLNFWSRGIWWLNCWTLKFELFSVLLSLDSILFTYSLCLEPFVMAFLGGRTSSTRSK